MMPYISNEILDSLTYPLLRPDKTLKGCLESMVKLLHCVAKCMYGVAVSLAKSWWNYDFVETLKWSFC
jgi:hypothetical protein